MFHQAVSSKRRLFAVSGAVWLLAACGAADIDPGAESALELDAKGATAPFGSVDIPGPVALGGSSAIAGAAGRGGEAGAAGQGGAGGVGGVGGAGGVAGSGGTAGTNSSIGFGIDVPGADRPVPARVASAKSPSIVVQTYPATLTLPVRYGLLPVGFEGAFSDAYCADIRSTAKLATNASVKELVRRMLRKQGTVTARIPLSSVVGPTFVASAITAARKAGAQSAALIDNPVVFSASQVSLELAPDAISNILGDVPALLESVSAPLTQQAKLAYQTGYYSAPISAKDLWCDLAQGKATVRVKVSGKAGAQAYAAQTVVTRVKPL